MYIEGDHELSREFWSKIEGQVMIILAGPCYKTVFGFPPRTIPVKKSGGSTQCLLYSLAAQAACEASSPWRWQHDHRDVFDGFLWRVQAVQPVLYGFFGGRHERDIEGTAAGKISKAQWAKKLCNARGRAAH